MEDQQEPPTIEAQIDASMDNDDDDDKDNDQAINTPTDHHRFPTFDFDHQPRRLYHFSRQFRRPTIACEEGNNFLKGVKWSPDGSAFLTCSDDNALRMFTLPEDAWTGAAMWNLADVEDQDSYDCSVAVKESEMVYDFCWYPYACASDPATCVFASTIRDHPIHLWDASTGQLRCSYRAYDNMDEITAALSVAFSTTGSKIFAGYNKCLRVFDVHRPGRDFEQHALHKGDACPSGIASSMAFSPHGGMLAVGSYSQTTAIYAEDNMELLYILHGQLGGVTQVMFSKCGNYLYTGGRKDPYILCWDIRNTVGIVYQLYRSAEDTNQRISFDIEPCGQHLATGGQDGLVHIYDLQSGEWKSSFQAASDTVNGFSFHPSLPLATTSSGNRRFDMSENSEEKIYLHGDENCASVWSFHAQDMETSTFDRDEELDPKNL